MMILMTLTMMNDDDYCDDDDCDDGANGDDGENTDRDDVSNLSSPSMSVSHRTDTNNQAEVNKVNNTR